MLQEGLEPPTLGLLDPCSTKLSYQSCAAHARDRTKDLQIFSLTLSQLSYVGIHYATSGNWYHKDKIILIVKSSSVPAGN